MEKVAYEFAKGESELVKARLSEFNGRIRADLRIFFKNGDGEWLPTKRGINFPLNLVEEMKEAIARIDEESRNLK